MKNGIFTSLWIGVKDLSSSLFTRRSFKLGYQRSNRGCSLCLPPTEKIYKLKGVSAEARIITKIFVITIPETGFWLHFR